MANKALISNKAAQDGGSFVFAFTRGLWLYYATGRLSRRDPSSASSYPPSP